MCVRVYVLSRPEKEHNRGSRPRGTQEGAPGAAVLGHGKQGLEGVAPVGEAPVGKAPVGKAPVAAGALRRDPRWDDLPLGIGEIACICGARRLANDWRRNGGIKTRREQGRCHRAWRDP